MSIDQYSSHDVESTHTDIATAGSSTSPEALILDRLKKEECKFGGNVWSHIESTACEISQDILARTLKGPCYDTVPTESHSPTSSISDIARIRLESQIALSNFLLGHEDIIVKKSKLHDTLTGQITRALDTISDKSDYQERNEWYNLIGKLCVSALTTYRDNPNLIVLAPLHHGFRIRDPKQNYNALHISTELSASYQNRNKTTRLRIVSSNPRRKSHSGIRTVSSNYVLRHSSRDPLNMDTARLLTRTKSGKPCLLEDEIGLLEDSKRKLVEMIKHEKE